uniref:F-box associated domain-containing protein n=1 Tax=Oryza barthii TaxID=65489 RepID=A0A0D3G4S9_9ORYZ
MRRPCDYSQDADWTGQLNRVQGTMAASSYDADGDRVLALWLLRDYDEEAWECVYRVATGFLGDVARTMGFFVAHMSDDSGGGDALLRSSQGHRLKRGEVVAADRELGGDDDDGDDVSSRRNMCTRRALFLPVHPPPPPTLSPPLPLGRCSLPPTGGAAP